MASVAPFPDGTVEEISRAIGDTSNGLSGSDITRIFKTCDIAEMSDGDTTKWKRIANTFVYVVGDGVNLPTSDGVKIPTP